MDNFHLFFVFLLLFLPTIQPRPWCNVHEPAMAEEMLIQKFVNDELRKLVAWLIKVGFGFRC